MVKTTPMAQPTVLLETTFGTIHIALEPEKAPKSVENFLKYVDDGHYAGTVFHRVIGNFMVQGGGYDEKYEKKPVRDPVENEADNGLKNVRGSVAMARTTDPHSATAQFFINVVDNAFLDHKGKTPSDWGYTVFGTVTSGMDVVDKIKAVPTAARGSFQKDVPVESVVIKSATRA
jgi:cyclophilin family peptidyl-prolyl cis-trans isomerase